MVYLCKWDKHLRTPIYFKQGGRNCVTWTVRRSDAVIFFDEKHALDAALINGIHDFMLIVSESEDNYEG